MEIGKNLAEVVMMVAAIAGFVAVMWIKWPRD